MFLFINIRRGYVATYNPCLGKMFFIVILHFIFYFTFPQLTVKETVSSLWFASMSQKAVTAVNALNYITAISKFSLKLLDVIINFQDETVS